MSIEEERQKRKEWLDSLKVGDEVCYNTGSFSYGSYVIAQIDKVTPTRRFQIGEMKFDSEGREMGKTDRWTATKEMQHITDKVRDHLLREKVLLKIGNTNFKALNIEDLKVIYEVINKPKDK